MIIKKIEVVIEGIIKKLSYFASPDKTSANPRYKINRCTNNPNLANCSNKYCDCIMIHCHIKEKNIYNHEAKRYCSVYCINIANNTSLYTELDKTKYTIDTTSSMTIPKICNRLCKKLRETPCCMYHKLKLVTCINILKSSKYMQFNGKKKHNDIWNLVQKDFELIGL